MNPEQARVVQITDTHLSAEAGLPDSMRWLLDHVVADPPDAVALTGDLVLLDPDNADDRRFARKALDELPCPLLTIPGNHDIGFYGDEERRRDRIAAFIETWGTDRFALDLAGWRIVGANAYLLGEPEHDRWLGDAVTAADPVAVFIHQPVIDETNDGWEMPAPAREAFEAAIAGADVRLVASGHRHRYADRGRDVWVPSATIAGEQRDLDWSDPKCGAVEFTFSASGSVNHQLIQPPM
jgi:3',5'-cyclic AMP phosphodiesterase CpdA